MDQESNPLGNLLMTMGLLFLLIWGLWKSCG